MSSVSKSQTGVSNADKLTVGDDFGGLNGGILLVLCHAQVVVAESIELVGFFVDLVVEIHATCRDFDDHAFWDGLAVG